MTRFSFLHDAPAGPIDRIRSMRISEQLRTPLLALLTSVLVVSAWYGLERYWLACAVREEAAASMRLTESRADLAASKLMRANVDRMLVLDRRLRDIRLSGSVLAANLASVGNHLPPHVWLTSISSAANGMEISGRADGLSALSRTVAELMTNHTSPSPILVRANKDDGAQNLVTFTMQLDKPHEAR